MCADLSKDSKITSVEMTCSSCPLQYEGTLDTGEWFYYRNRWEHWTFDIYESKENGFREESYFHMEAPVTYWITPEELFEKAVEAYNEKKRQFRNMHKPYAISVWPQIETFHEDKRTLAEIQDDEDKERDRLRAKLDNWLKENPDKKSSDWLMLDFSKED